MFGDYLLSSIITDKSDDCNVPLPFISLPFHMLLFVLQNVTPLYYLHVIGTRYLLYSLCSHVTLFIFLYYYSLGNN